MDLRAVLKDLAEAFANARISYALMGGLALTPHRAGRATADLDFLVDGARADDVDAMLRAMGYRCLHRSADAANYLSDDPLKGRVDFIFARRPPTKRMLEVAKHYAVLGRTDVPVVDIEDLIGLKVQGFSNNPVRYLLDMADIQRLIEGTPELDLTRVREYFRLFERESDLDDLLARLVRR